MDTQINLTSNTRCFSSISQGNTPNTKPEILLNHLAVKAAKIEHYEISRRFGRKGQKAVDQLGQSLGKFNIKEVTVHWSDRYIGLELPGSASFSERQVREAVKPIYENSDFKPELYRENGRNYLLLLSRSMQKPREIALAEVDPLMEHEKVVSKSLRQVRVPYSYGHVPKGNCYPTQGNICAAYANVHTSPMLESAQIGNQQLVTFNDTHLNSISLEAIEKREYKDDLDYLVEFLRAHPNIRHVVDVGCGDAKWSLLMQKRFNVQGLAVQVFPCDIFNTYDRETPIRIDDTSTATGRRPLPINMIPGQEIIGASADTTLFTVIHTYTGCVTDIKTTCEEINKDKQKYFITSLIENNPGCYVFASEDTALSRPNLFIPAELVHTKHFRVLTDPPPKGDSQVTLAERWNKKGGEIDTLNQLMKCWEGYRHDYLKLVNKFKLINAADMTDNPQLPWPLIFFDYILANHRSSKITSVGELIDDLFSDKLCFSCWHVYRAEPTHSAH